LLSQFIANAALFGVCDVQGHDMANQPEQRNDAESLRHRWRFALVLAASLLLAVAQPMTSGLLGDQNSFDLFFSVLIAAVLLLVFDEREHRRIAVSLGAAGFAGLWIGHALGEITGRVLLVAAHLTAAAFFAYALYGILRSILAKRVTGDAIFGVVCGYLLLGISWGLVYSAMETAAPGSFRASAAPAGDAAPVDRGTLGYYSFVTLATVGYGDVIPTTPLARTLAWMEAVTGQFYLAVLVAGLVGFKVTQALKE
jgi:voltage-gated potassium channel